MERSRVGAAGFLIVAVLGTLGCATKKYVRQQTAPVSAKVDEVDKKHTEAVAALREQEVKDISRVDEKALGAQGRADDAMSAAQKADNRAGEAAQAAGSARQMAEQNQARVAELGEVVQNFDHYKLQTSVQILFGFDRAKVTTEGNQALDQLVAQMQAQPRYVIEVEGYTDQVGSSEYNLNLSRRRAEAVVRCLIERGVPLRQIHMIGLGNHQPLGTAQTVLTGSAGDTSAAGPAKAKEMRRVVIRLYFPEGPEPGKKTLLQSANPGPVNR